MSDNREHATTCAMNGRQIMMEKLEQENAALRARLREEMSKSTMYK